MADDTARTPLCVLSVHAHPDDEASKGAATMARYAPRASAPSWSPAPVVSGGDPQPAADSDEARTDLAAVRRRELDESVRIIGYDALHMLGYPTPAWGDRVDAHPDTFANRTSTMPSAGWSRSCARSDRR